MIHVQSARKYIVLCHSQLNVKHHTSFKKHCRSLPHACDTYGDVIFGEVMVCLTEDVSLFTDRNL